MKIRHLIILSVGIAVILAFIPIPYVAPFIIVISGMFIGIFAILHIRGDMRDKTFLITLFTAAFLARVLLAVLMFNCVFTMTKGFTGLIGDGGLYSENGARIAQLWTEGKHDEEFIYKYVHMQSRSGKVGNYDYWNAMVYFVVGESPLTVVFINCMAGALVLILIYDITKRLSNRKSASFAAILAGFWPSTLFWSIQNLKDPITMLLICLIMWVTLELFSRFRIYLVLLMSALSALLFKFRAFALMPFMLVIPVSAFARIPFGKYVRVLIVMLVGTLMITLGSDLRHFLPSLFSWEGIIQWSYRIRSFTATGGSAFLTDWDYTSIPQFMLFFPLALSVAWLAPFPWQLGSPRQISAVPEMMVFYMLLPCLLYGAGYILKNKRKEGLAILMYIVLISCILALFEGNVGTLFRHRSWMLPLCFIPIGIGLNHYKFRVVSGGRK